MNAHSEIACPCCSQPVRVPTLEIIIDHCKVSEGEARLLRAVWRGKGHPVPIERLFDVIYADDPNGGPSPSSMYNAFKVMLSRLRDKLEGTGVSIVHAGRGRGYRLVIGEEENGST